MKVGPLLSPSVLIGAGMGGFFDGIVFHQIFQTHNMLSAQIPPDTLVRAKVNMTYDGWFHFAVWIMCLLGLILLVKAGKRHDVPWSARIIAGGWILGWGLFNLVEGIIDHHVLGLHHVMEYAPNKLPYDLLFLAWGAVMTIVGWAMIRTRRIARSSSADAVVAERGAYLK